MGPKVRQMRHTIKREYYRRVRVIWSSSLNGGGKVRVHNSVAGGYFRYYAPLFSWTSRELTSMDSTTRRILRVNKCHHRAASVPRLYLPRKKGGRGITGVEMEWERAVVSASAYKLQSPDPQLKGVVRHDYHQECLERKTQRQCAAQVLSRYGLPEEWLRGRDSEGKRVKPSSLVGRLKTAQVEKLHSTLLSRKIHGRHAQELQLPPTNRPASTRWLVEGRLDGRTEADIIAAQDGVTHTRKYLVEVAGHSGPTTCGACGRGPESIGHVLAACEAQLFHLIKWRHDRVLYLLVRALLQGLGLSLPREFHAIGGVAQPGVYGTETQVVKVDLRSPTIDTVKACRPDVIVRLEEQQEMYLFDVACSWEGGVEKREREKYLKYQALAADLARQWTSKVAVIPVVIGVLGTIKRAEEHLAKIPFLTSREVKDFLATAQREVLVCSIRILKQHFRQ